MAGGVYPTDVIPISAPFPSNLRNYSGLFFWKTLEKGRGLAFVEPDVRNGIHPRGGF